MIDSKQISVVMQGPITGASRDQIANNVLSVRKVLPDSQLIVVTWKGAEVSAVHDVADQIIELDDPGTTTLGWDQKCNVDRQLKSVHTGLAAATSEFAVRMRLDTALENDLFVRAYEKMLADESLATSSLFQQRVMATSIYFRDAAKSNYLFHPSDIFHFGLRKDLLALWRAPLVQEKKSAAYQLALVPEQYIWIHYLISNDIPAAHLDAQRFRWRSMAMSEWSLATNWWVIDAKSNGIVLPDRFLTSNLPEKTHFETEWREFVKRSGTRPSLRACRWNVLRKFTRKVKWP